MSPAAVSSRATAPSPNMRLRFGRRNRVRYRNDAQWEAEATAISGRVPGGGVAAPRYLSAFAVWDRGPGTGGVCVDRPASWRRREVVAGATPGADWLWKFAVPAIVLIRGEC